MLTAVSFQLIGVRLERHQARIIHAPVLVKKRSHHKKKPEASAPAPAIETIGTMPLQMGV